MPLYSSNGASILRPEEIADLIVRPVQAASFALRVTTNVRTGAPSYRFPIVTADASASWVVEGAEIPVTDPGLTELIVHPTKVGGMSVISREIAEDSSPEAAGLVGDGLARKIARTLDRAFFGPPQAAPAAAGLLSVPDVATVDAGASWADLDPFSEALSLAEQQGAVISNFVGNPADVLALSTVKVGTGYTTPLLNAAGPTSPTNRTILGVPLLSCPDVVAGTVWAIPGDRVFAVIREDVRLEASEFPLFTSDEVLIKATMRAGFAVPHPAAVVRVHLTP